MSLQTVGMPQIERLDDKQLLKHQMHCFEASQPSQFRVAWAINICFWALAGRFAMLSGFCSSFPPA